MTAEPWVSVENIAADRGGLKNSGCRWIDGKGLPLYKVGRLRKLGLSEVDDRVRSCGAEDEGE